MVGTPLSRQRGQKDSEGEHFIALVGRFPDFINGFPPGLGVEGRKGKSHFIEVTLSQNCETSMEFTRRSWGRGAF